MPVDPFLSHSQDGGTSPLPRLNAGQRLFNKRYELLRALGAGGMGVVWLARDHTEEAEVALKFLPGVLVLQEAEMRRLREEVRAGKELRHPRLVATYGLEVEDGAAAIVMEYVAGQTLKEKLEAQQRGFFEPEEIAPWVPDICAGLAYLHEEARRIHRDVKPANIIVDGTSRARLMDFGISHRVQEAVTRQSKTGEAGGASGSSSTMAYASPQQLSGRPAHPAEDMYSLGATLYELLTGTPPFYRGGAEAVAIQIKMEPVTPLMERRAELVDEGLNASVGADPGPAWEALVQACLAKEREARPRAGAVVVPQVSDPPAVLWEEPPAHRDTAISVPPRHEVNHVRNMAALRGLSAGVWRSIKTLRGRLFRGSRRVLWAGGLMVAGWVIVSVASALKSPRPEVRPVTLPATPRVLREDIAATPAKKVSPPAPAPPKESVVPSVTPIPPGADPVLLPIATQMKGPVYGLYMDRPFGLIDGTGKVVSSPQWDKTGKLSEGLIRVQKSGNSGFLDWTGKVILPPSGTYGEYFSEGLAPRQNAMDGKWGYINPKGVFVLPPEWDEASPFIDGVARTNKGGPYPGWFALRVGNWGYIDPSGKVVSPPQWDNAWDFEDGMGMVQMGKEGGYRYVDRTGKVVDVPIGVEGTGSFHNGYASAKKGDKWGVIDKAGKFVVSPQWQFVGRVSEGLVPVQSNYKWGFADLTGKIVIPLQWDSARSFDGGLAKVGKDAKEGFIDKNGKVVIPLTWLVAGSFEDGFAKVWESIDGKHGYIDKTGKVVVPLEWDSTDSVRVGKAGAVYRRVSKRIANHTVLVAWLGPDLKEIWRAELPLVDDKKK